MSNKKCWMIVDVRTGAIDGFYFAREDAQAAYDRAIERGCFAVTLCEVLQSAEHARISDHTFWCRNPHGYAGDSQPLRLRQRESFL